MIALHPVWSRLMQGIHGQIVCRLVLSLSTALRGGSQSSYLEEPDTVESVTQLHLKALDVSLNHNKSTIKWSPGVLFFCQITVLALFCCIPKCNYQSFKSSCFHV